MKLILEQVKTLQADIERLSKDVNTYKTSSTEYQIKMETLQQYFKQQVTDLHRFASLGLIFVPRLASVASYNEPK